MRVLYVSHPEVVVDHPAVPVPRWHLSDRGIARMRRFVAGLARPAAVWASTECKAVEAAGILAAAHGLPVQVREDLGENDRSATDYLPRAEFQAVADRFFAEPESSVRGWERAADAQARIVAPVAAVLAAPRGPGDVVVVGHGGVGALLLAHLTGRPISRSLDQRGQGCWYAAARRLLADRSPPIPQP